ncbi:MAG TPA: PqqD family peptide modification chaperone [Planctomycetota bacterium]|nr:PqqD family peptide modification chaperone [Planctomycetota bacterium]
MNTDILKGNWKQFRGEVKRKWGQLTDDDLDQIEGQREKLVGKVQERYGKARDQAMKDVDAFLDEVSRRNFERKP